MCSRSTKWLVKILAILSLSLAHNAGAYTVTGCFIDINSQGVAGLTVAATGDTTNTGADGCFSMSDVSTGTDTLTMSGDGYQSRTLSFTKVSANNKSANIGTKYAIATPNGYKVKISVVDRATGQALEGVTFTINGAPVQVESNAYVLGVSEPGSYTLTATKANYDSVSVNFAVNDNSPVSQMGTIRLWGGSYQVIGRVVDGAKNPVADAEVTLSTGDSVTTAADGTFTIDGFQTATTFNLTATKAGYTSITRNNYSVNNNVPVRNMGDLVIQAGGYQVTGRVVDAEKNPVADAQVTLSTGDSITTAADGTFTIDGFQTATTFNLTATKAGYTSITRNNYSVNNYVPVRNMGDLVIQAGGYQVTGRVVDIDQNPIAGVTLNLNVGDSSTTGPDGTFVVAGIMNPTAFNLTGTKSGYQDIVRTGSVTESSPTRQLGDVYMIATENGYRITGCVKDAGGNGLPQVQITVANQTVVTDTTGCYQIRLDNPGSFSLTAQVVQDIEIPNPRHPDQTITVSKDRFLPITKSVRLSESSPVANVSPCVFSPSIRMSLQASSNVVVENSDLVYTVTLTNHGNAPFVWAEMWSEPELPNCWSFVGGTTGEPLQAVEHSTRPLPPYPAGINTPLNCNLSDDNGHSHLPYPRLGSNPAALPFLVNYPFQGHPNANVLECKELGLLGAGQNTQVQAVVHAGCSGGSGGSPFALKFGAKATPFVLKFNADGTPICPSGCENSGYETSSTAVLPKPLPKLKVALTAASSQVRLGENQVLRYNLTVSNQATDKMVSTGVILNIPVPAEMAVDSVTLDESQGQCNVVENDINCYLNDMPSGTEVPVVVQLTPSKVEIGSVGAELISNETENPQIVALNYTVLRALTECEKQPTCDCNPALCPVPPADVAIVIDDTGSMSEEIGGLRNGLSTFMNKLAGTEGKPTLQLVTYKDNYTHRITTDNLTRLRDSYVNYLRASGGDDCPENAGGAIAWVVNNTAANRLKEGGRILLITDASPHDDTDIDKLISQLRARGISLDVLLSDNSCLADGAKLDAVVEFAKMAEETDGFFLKNLGINDPDDESAIRHYENTVLDALHSSIKPTIIAASTNTVPAGSTVEMLLGSANTNFNEMTKLLFAQSTKTKRRTRDGKNGGIIVNHVTVISATKLLANITIPEDVQPGFYNIVAETQVGELTERAEGYETLEITAPRGVPEILSVMPTSALQDSEMEVTVYATQTHFNAGAQLSFADPGIIVKQTRIQSNTSLTALIEVSEHAKLGLHHVTVMSGNETASSADAKFMVVAESTSARIKTLSANRGIRGGLVKFDIVGKHTHFEEGKTELRLLEGISIVSFEVTSPTTASALILVDAEAPLGYQDVIMVTGDEVAVKLNGFEISERGPHGVSGYALDQVKEPVAKVYVSLRGQGVFTDATGYFRMTGLTTGEYTLTGDNAGYHFTPETFTVGQPPAEMATVVLQAASALAVKIKADDWHPAKQGSKVDYTVTVTNKGTETATGIVLMEILPDNTSLAALEGGNCQISSASCQLRDLGPNQQVEVKVTINNTQTRTLINTVTVTSNEYPPATVKHWKRVLPYLSVVVEATPDPVVPEGRMHYTLDVDLSPYAPTPATDVQLVTRLPQGVELQSLNTEYGSCDTSAIPTIICDLVDLSVDTPKDISHITVTLDAILKDPGLLLLTHEAKVVATEYPAHLTRERTEVLIGDGVEVDIAFVIDVTDSMQGEINGIIKALRHFTNELDATTAPSIALVTFRDEVTVKAVTRDNELLEKVLVDIEASGGGTCEEAAVEALQIVIPHVKEGGKILFATDASPYPDADIQGVLEMLKKKAIRFNSLITGDCNDKKSWNELP